MNFCFLACHVAPQHKAYISRVDLAMRLSLGRQAVSRSEVCEGWEWRWGGEPSWTAWMRVTPGMAERASLEQNHPTVLEHQLLVSFLRGTILTLHHMRPNFKPHSLSGLLCEIFKKQLKQIYRSGLCNYDLPLFLTSPVISVFTRAMYTAIRKEGIQ